MHEYIKTLAAHLSIVGLVTVGNCASAAAAGASQALPPLALQQATNINALSASFLASHIAHDGLSNAMVSPVSLFYALAMLHEGSNGATRATVAELLLTDGDDTEPHETAKALAGVLESESGDNERGMFQLANSIWSTTLWTIRPFRHFPGF